MIGRHHRLGQEGQHRRAVELAQVLGMDREGELRGRQRACIKEADGKTSLDQARIVGLQQGVQAFSEVGEVETADIGCSTNSASLSPAVPASRRWRKAVSSSRPLRITSIWLSIVALAMPALCIAS